MTTNSEIYLIGLSVLIFLIVVFLFIRKVSNEGKLKLKIEKVSDLSTSNILQEIPEKQESFNFNKEVFEEQELVIFNLISMDRSMFDIDQIFGFLSNLGAKNTNNYFAFYEDEVEKFRIINALKPGTFQENTQTFAVAIVADLHSSLDPYNTVKQMIEFAVTFSDKFYATLCDQDRTPITKQMISHVESKAQDIARLKQLNKNKTIGA